MVKSGRLFDVKRFQAWRNAFAGNFTLRPMIRSALTNGDLLEEFTIHGFGTDSFAITPFDDDDKSLDLQDLMLLKALQARLANQPKTTYHPFRREVAQQIADQYDQDARAVDNAFFDTDLSRYPDAGNDSVSAAEIEQ